LVIGLEDIEFRADRPMPDIKLLVGLSVCGSEREFRQMLEFVKMMVAQDPNIQVEEGSLEGTNFTRFRSKRAEFTADIEVALFQNSLLIGIGTEVVTRAIERLRDSESDTLADDDSFGRCMQRISHADDVVRIHVDTAGLLARFGNQLPPEVRMVLDLLGMEHVAAFAGALRIDGKDLVTTSFLDSPGGNDFLTSLLRQHKVDRDLLEHVPASATSFSLFALDGAALLGQLRAKLPPEPLSDVEDALEQLREDGFDLERDILPVFGPQAALVTLPAGRRGAKGIDMFWNQLLGTALLVKISDREKALSQLARLPKSRNQMVRFEERIGATHVIGYRFTAPQLPREFGLFIAPAGDYLVVAMSREGMRQMLQRPSSAAIDHFRKEIRAVPPEATSLGYDDMSQGSGLLLQAMVSGMEQARRAQAELSGKEIGTEFDWSKLPTGDFNPAISYTVADEHGILNHAKSPTGGLIESGGITGALVAASIALPNLAQARIQANEEAAMESLRAIRNAQVEYRTGLVRDSDTDGEGEHAFLSELLGDKHGREGGRATEEFLSGFDRAPLGYRKNGYYFRVYLPAEDGSPVGGHEHAGRLKQVDGDLAETIVVVVAWPRSEGTTGRRSFILDGRGKIRFTRDGYGGEDAPAPDLFSSQRGNLAAAPIKRRQRPHDGRLWIEVK